MVFRMSGVCVVWLTCGGRLVLAGKKLRRLVVRGTTSDLALTVRLNFQKTIRCGRFLARTPVSVRPDPTFNPLYVPWQPNSSSLSATLWCHRLGCTLM